MSNRRDIEPSLDYFELRRRHEEYKNSQRQATRDQAGVGEEIAEAASRQEKPDVQAPPAVEPEDVAREAAQAAAPAAEDVADAIDVASDALPEDVADTVDAGAPLPVSDELPDDDAFEEENFDDDFDEAVDDDDDGSDPDNPNPFDSFIHAFKGIRGHLANRFGRRSKPDEAYEDDYDEPEEPDDMMDEAGDASQDGEADVERAPVVEARDGDEAETSAEDVLDDLPVARPAVAAPGDDGLDEELDDEDFDDEDLDDEALEDEDEDQSRPVSGFKKFLRLFIVPIDEASEDGDDEEEFDGEDGEAWEDTPRDDEPVTGIEAQAQDGEADWAQPQTMADEYEGGPDMSDLNNVNSELTKELAADLASAGLSRRERRELALRQAAEKAAAEAEAEAARQAEAARVEAEAAAQQAQAEAQQAAEAAAQAEEVVQAAEALVEEKPLEPDDIEGVADGIVRVDDVKDDFDAMLDEPTREFKPVSKVNLDDLMNDKDLDDEDEDDEEEEERPARRGLFGRRRNKKAEEEDDEDDYDDEDDEDEDDEEEEERPRRGLFGRRRRAEEEDDKDDDEDEDDDYDDDDDEEDRRRKSSRRGRRRYDEDDEDDDDDYDDYDDDYDDDDYDDYDDDDDGASFGHVLLGILKGFLTAVMLLLFVVVVLNVLNIFGTVNLDGFAARLPSRMVSVFLPSQNMKQRINVEANADPAPVVEAQPQVEELPAAQSELAQPEAAPAEEEASETETVEEPVEAAPVEETPEEESAGEAVG